MGAEQPLFVKVSGDVPGKFLGSLRSLAIRYGVTVELPPSQGIIPDLKTQVLITRIIHRIASSADPVYDWDEIFRLDPQMLSRRFQGIKERSKEWIAGFQRRVSSHRIDPLILQRENSHQVQPIRRFSGHQALLVDGLYIPLLGPSGIPGVVLNFLSLRRIDFSFWDAWSKEQIQRALKGNLTFFNNHFALNLRLGPEMRNVIYLELPGDVNILEPQNLIMKKTARI